MAPYEQLWRHIAAQIDSGELAVDARLPTVRDLARRTGLANNTAARAYRELEAAGYIRTEGRRGTFVAERPDPVAADHPAVSDQDPATTCMATEMALLRPEAFIDEQAVEDRFDPGFTMVDRDGQLLGRQTALEQLRLDATAPSTVDDLLSEQLAPGLVLVTYVTHRQARSCRHSSLWVGQVTGWRCRFRQSTPVY